MIFVIKRLLLCWLSRNAVLSKNTGHSAVMRILSVDYKLTCHVVINNCLKHNLEEIYKDSSQLKYIFYQELIWDKSNCTRNLR